MAILSVIAALFFTAHAASPKAALARGGFQTRFIGEGGAGAYSHPSSEASGAMEEGARQEGAAANPGGAPAAPAPSAAQRPPVLPFPVSPRPPAASARPAAGAAAPGAPRTENERRRYSLWEGLAAPLELPGHKVKDVGLDEARALGRRDYDAHILNARAGGDAAAWGVPQAAAPLSGAEVFVAVNLDLKNNAGVSLKDALADLGRVAAFRQDTRFEPSAVGRGPDQVALWGWMPANGIGRAMTVPAVARLELAGPARQPERFATADILIGVRLAGGAAPAEALARLRSDLADTGLRVKRSIGTQTAPGSGENVLVVEAGVPVAALSRVMAHKSVIKIVAAPQPAPAPARPPLAALGRFFSFATAHYPALLILTLLMLLPSVARVVASAARVFVPYR
ncbi:MAG: hypothetical protein PHF00_06300 [Elusimicrobia bacterium]|nr:hypothetical protein [Elusimicrobiota bacterium]